MFKSTIAKALLGVAGLGVAGGTTAMAASPSPAATQAAAAKRHALTSQGIVVRVSSSELVIRHPERKPDPSASAPTADTTSFELTLETTVYRAGDPSHKLGLDALAAGQRVRVLYASKDNAKVARRVVILPEVRYGKVISKDIDANGKETFHIQNRNDSYLITVTPETRFYEGRKGKAQGSFTDMQVGQRVIVLGQADGHDNFDAAVVRYFTPDRAPKASTPKS